MTDSVLLIHDDPGLLRTIGARFEQAGCEVLRELNGEAGLATVDRARPDVVCLALHLAQKSPDLVPRLGATQAPVLALGDRPDPATSPPGPPPRAPPPGAHTARRHRGPGARLRRPTGPGDERGGASRRRQPRGGHRGGARPPPSTGAGVKH